MPADMLNALHKASRVIPAQGRTGIRCPARRLRLLETYNAGKLCIELDN
jgi:hypothetical protein